MRLVSACKIAVLALVFSTGLVVAASAEDAVAPGVATPAGEPQQAAPSVAPPADGQQQSDVDRAKSYRPSPPAAAAQPAAPAESAAPKPVADAAPTSVNDCVDDNGEFATIGKRYAFVVTLTNKCEKRLKCVIDAYITGAKGPSSGHGSLMLAPKSQGEKAKKAFTMKVKTSGGTAEVSRDCKVF